MRYSDEEIDALLAGYMDQELSLDEATSFEQLLSERPDLAERLVNWKANQSLLKKLIDPTLPSLGPNFASRVLAEAQNHPSLVDDPGLAPWIARERSSPSVEPASKLNIRNQREATAPPLNSAGNYRWIFRGAIAVGTAACLLLAVFLIPSNSKNTNHLLSSHSASALKGPATVELESQTNISPQPESAEIAKSKTLPVENQAVTPTLPNDKSKTLASNSPAVGLDNKSSASSQNRTTDSSVSSSEGRTAQPFANSTVATDLQLSPDQMKMVEAFSPTAPGAFVFVIDVSLPKGVQDTETLQDILAKNDIPWASQLDVDEFARRKLVGSRMISEAAKQGLLPDVVPVTPSETQAGLEESVSLIFVKGRGQRLDKALIEIMRRIDDFPEFSFDLAFDPPIQSMVEELRFIQEAKLATLEKSASGAANAIRIRSETEPGDYQSFFAAAPRRSPSMSRNVRRKAAELGNSEIMNPVAYALMIVRHSR